MRTLYGKYKRIHTADKIQAGNQSSPPLRPRLVIEKNAESRGGLLFYINVNKVFSNQKVYDIVNLKFIQKMQSTTTLYKFSMCKHETKFSKRLTYDEK